MFKPLLDTAMILLMAPLAICGIAGVVTNRRIIPILPPAIGGLGIFVFVLVSLVWALVVSSGSRAILGIDIPTRSISDFGFVVLVGGGCIGLGALFELLRRTK